MHINWNGRIDARLLEVEASFVEVVGFGRKVGVVERIGRSDRLIVSDPAVAAKHRLEHRLAIDGIF